MDDDGQGEIVANLLNTADASPSTALLGIHVLEQHVLRPARQSLTTSLFSGGYNGSYDGHEDTVEAAADAILEDTTGPIMVSIFFEALREVLQDVDAVYGQILNAPEGRGGEELRRMLKTRGGAAAVAAEEAGRESSSSSSSSSRPIGDRRAKDLAEQSIAHVFDQGGGNVARTVQIATMVLNAKELQRLVSLESLRSGGVSDEEAARVNAAAVENLKCFVRNIALHSAGTYRREHYEELTLIINALQQGGAPVLKKTEIAKLLNCSYNVVRSVTGRELDTPRKTRVGKGNPEHCRAFTHEVSRIDSNQKVKKYRYCGTTIECTPHIRDEPTLLLPGIWRDSQCRARLISDVRAQYHKPSFAGRLCLECGPPASPPSSSSSSSPSPTPPPPPLEDPKKCACCAGGARLRFPYSYYLKYRCPCLCEPSIRACVCLICFTLRLLLMAWHRFREENADAIKEAKETCPCGHCALFRSSGGNAFGYWRVTEDYETGWPYREATLCPARLVSEFGVENAPQKFREARMRKPECCKGEPYFDPCEECGFFDSPCPAEMEIAGIALLGVDVFAEAPRGKEAAADTEFGEPETRGKSNKRKTSSSSSSSSKKKDTRMQLVRARKEMTLRQLFEEIKKHTPNYHDHYFDFRIQALMIDLLPYLLTRGDLMLQRDFAAQIAHEHSGSLTCATFEHSNCEVVVVSFLDKDVYDGRNRWERRILRTEVWFMICGTHSKYKEADSFNVSGADAVIMEYYTGKTDEMLKKHRGKAAAAAAAAKAALEDPKKMKVGELRLALEKGGLASDGGKSTLARRYQQFLNKEAEAAMEEEEEGAAAAEGGEEEEEEERGEGRSSSSSSNEQYLRDHFTDWESAKVWDGLPPSMKRQFFRVFGISDGCAGQYKGRKRFKRISEFKRRFGIDAVMFFAATAHFKGFHDALGKLISRINLDFEKVERSARKRRGNC